VDTHISLVYDAAGQVIASIEVFRDISQQEEYRLLQEKFNSMIRKYVSSTTYSDVKARLSNDNHQKKPKIQDLTVFYLDIVNFTSFSESNQPEEVVNMLNELFGICEVITKECFGDIDKFIGDAIMAVFTDANDAVRAALQILNKSLPEMNRIRQENQEKPIQVRIGINSGLLLQGDIGTLDRKDLTVIGDTVNIAARLEKTSLPNRLLISEATYSRLNKELVGSFSEYHSLELKGKTELIHSFMNNLE
jgi:class 3 adenylate cyclase